MTGTTTKQEALDRVQALTVADVLKAYEGRPGCMCGCLGRYHVTADSFEEAGAERGYPYDEKDVNEKKVLRVLRRVQAEAADGNVEVGDGGYAYAEVGRKCWAVYLRAGSRE